MKIKALKSQTAELRKTIIEMLYEAGSGHPGGSLSAVEIVTALYFDVMHIDPENPVDPLRDRFVLSKGHACPVVYAALAGKGFFPAEDLFTLRKIDSYLQGHPDMKHTPGIDVSTGSLGQGLSMGLGMALSAKQKGQDWNTFVLMGDGEVQEGSIWEAAMGAAHHKADNLVGILDRNGIQLDGRVDDLMSLGDIEGKWRAFGWETHVCDGHDLEQVLNILRFCKSGRNGKPHMVIANTVKGKGVSFMENNPAWHGSPLSEQNYIEAMKELNKRKVG